MLTVAVNCCVAAVATEAVDGETETETGLRVMIAEVDLVVSATEVAFTVAVEMEEIVAGAVYRPLVDRIPAPVRDHVTAVLEVPVTVAVNC